MHSPVQSEPVPAAKVWTGRVISALVIIFLLFDSVSKIMKMANVVEQSAKLGFDATAVVQIGVILLICTVLYIIPRTAILGAILLTGYLGGAVCTSLRAGAPLPLILFPFVFGVIVWVPLYLRESRLRALIPVTS
jgi:hypothetical protein